MVSPIPPPPPVAPTTGLAGLAQPLPRPVTAPVIGPAQVSVATPTGASEYAFWTFRPTVNLTDANMNWYRFDGNLSSGTTLIETWLWKRLIDDEDPALWTLVGSAFAPQTLRAEDGWEYLFGLFDADFNEMAAVLRVSPPPVRVEVSDPDRESIAYHNDGAFTPEGEVSQLSFSNPFFIQTTFRWRIAFGGAKPGVDPDAARMAWYLAMQEDSGTWFWNADPSDGDPYIGPPSVPPPPRSAYDMALSNPLDNPVGYRFGYNNAASFGLHTLDVASYSQVHRTGLHDAEVELGPRGDGDKTPEPELMEEYEAIGVFPVAIGFESNRCQILDAWVKPDHRDDAEADDFDVVWSVSVPLDGSTWGPYLPDPDDPETFAVRGGGGLKPLDYQNAPGVVTLYNTEGAGPPWEQVDDTGDEPFWLRFNWQSQYEWEAENAYESFGVTEYPAGSYFTAMVKQMAHANDWQDDLVDLTGDLTGDGLQEVKPPGLSSILPPGITGSGPSGSSTNEGHFRKFLGLAFKFQVRPADYGVYLIPEMLRAPVLRHYPRDGDGRGWGGVTRGYPPPRGRRSYGGARQP